MLKRPLKSQLPKVTAVLKDNKGKVLSGKKVTMKLMVKFTNQQPTKGVTTFTINLTKKGTFKAKTKFAGDSYYTEKSINSKIIVKYLCAIYIFPIF